MSDSEEYHSDQDVDGEGSEAPPPPPRAFIHNVNSYMGQSIARTLKSRGQYVVVGMPLPADSTYESRDVKDFVDETVEAGTSIDELLPVLQSCDLIIYDALTGLQDASSAITVLGEAPGAPSPVEDRVRTFVLVSTVMTWASTVKAKAAAQGDEDEDDEGAEDDPGFSEQDYLKRRPHPSFKAHLELEKLVKKCEKPSLKTYVLFSGILYGDGESMFHHLFKTAWLGGEDGEVPVIGDGANVIPTIHVRDLAQLVYLLPEQRPKQTYIVAVDSSNDTQLSIAKTVAKQLGVHGRIKYVSESAGAATLPHVEFLHELDLKVTAGYIVDELDEEEMKWAAHDGVVSSISGIIDEYRKTRDLQPVRAVVVGPPASGRSTYARELAAKYKTHHISLTSAIAAFDARGSEVRAWKKAIEDEEERKRLEEEAAEAEEEEAEEEEEEEAEAEAEEEEEDEEAETEEAGEAEAGEEVAAEGDGGDNDGAEVSADDDNGEAGSDGEGEAEAPASDDGAAADQQDVEIEEAADAEPQEVLPSDTYDEEQVQKAEEFLEMYNEMQENSRTGANGAYSADAVTKILQWFLRTNAIQNQGYIMDAFPMTKDQAATAFSPEDDDAGDAEADGDEEEGGTGESPRINPQFVVVLEAEKEKLEERIMALPESAEGSMDQQTFENRYQEWAKYNNSDKIESVEDFFNAMELPIIYVPVFDNTLDRNVDFIVAQMGPAHNYGPSADELEAAAKKQQEAEQQRRHAEQRAAEEQRSREEAESARRKKLKEEHEQRLLEAEKHEREQLEVRSLPLRRYLMENVMPTLTAGLMEVAKVRPSDPIDYLSEWLFKHNPVDEDPVD